VRFGSKADMCSAKGHVCFTPESDAECVHSNVRYGPIADIGTVTAVQEVTPPRAAKSTSFR
ncbi:MAG: hypothetical protein WA375_21720, partial [Pseudolabrys sp.]